MAVGKSTIRLTIVSETPFGEMAVGKLTWYCAVPELLLMGKDNFLLKALYVDWL